MEKGHVHKHGTLGMLIWGTVKRSVKEDEEKGPEWASGHGYCRRIARREPRNRNKRAGRGNIRLGSPGAILMPEPAARTAGVRSASLTAQPLPHL